MRRTFKFIQQLASRVAFHEHLLPVCLPPPELRELDPGTNCTVIGWGKREDKHCKYQRKKLSLKFSCNLFRKKNAFKPIR